jgi:hypothetical protein
LWFGCFAIAATGGGARCNPHRRETGNRHGATAPRRQALELQATFAGGFGQRLDAAVVAVARAVERDLLDAGRLRALGDDLANLGRGILVLAVASGRCMTSACTVEADASTFAPSAVNSWAYRCWPVRSTVRRGTPSSRMCARVDLARRRRAVFLMLMVWFLVKLKARDPGGD